jgi:hypothetical protein
VSRGDRVPERLRSRGGTDLERRLLNAAAGEEPARELLDRMAGALGLPAAKIADGLAAPKPSAAPPSTWMAARSTSLVRWTLAGIGAVAVAGAAVVLRSPDGRRAPTTPAPALSLQSPATPPAQEPPEAPHATPVTAEAAPRVAPSAAPVRHRPEAPADEIAAQIALIDTARAALAAGAPDRALDVASQYLSRYAAGSFRPEAKALRIEALAKMGRTGEARALAQQFAAEHPGSPLTDRIGRAVGVSAP